MGIDFRIEIFSFRVYEAEDGDDFAKPDGYIGDGHGTSGIFRKDHNLISWEREVTIELGRQGILRQPMCDLQICTLDNNGWMPVCGKAEISIERALAYIKAVREYAKEFYTQKQEYWTYKHAEAILNELVYESEISDESAGFKVVISWG